MSSRLRRFAAPLVVGLLAAGFGIWVSRALLQATERPLPKLTLPSPSGEPVALQRFAGRPVVVNLWATWCPPCRREMPVLAAAQREHPSVSFVFADQGEGAAAIERYLAEQKLELQNVLLDSGTQFSQQFTVPGLPTTLFFDRSGQLVDTHVGELSASRLAEHLAKLKAP